MLKRVVTGLLGAAVAIWLVFLPTERPFPGFPLWLAVLILAWLGLGEFYRGCQAQGMRPHRFLGGVALLAWMLAAIPSTLDSLLTLFPMLFGFGLIPLALTALVVASLIAEVTRRPHEERSPLRNVGATWLGALYVGWLFPFIARLRLHGEGLMYQVGWRAGELPEWMERYDGGAWLLLFVLLVTWANDSGAMLGGKAFGKHQMTPHLSPGKTWEGAATGTALCLAIAYGLGIWLHLPTAFVVGVGLICSVLGPLGDLSSSAFKRELGLKDFGGLLPGHGGVLDRFDSLLFNAVGVYYLAAIWPSG